MISEEEIVTDNNEQYIICKRICEKIGLSRGQYQNEFKRIRKDPLLKYYTRYFSIETSGGCQDMLCIHIKVLSMWLSKINFKILKQDQYNNIVSLINYLLKGNYANIKLPEKFFDSETELRDEIYNIGHFNDIQILDKEVIYDFGRIDLLGIDNNNKKVCIELKKLREFNDSKEQLLKYKESMVFDRVVFCAYIIADDLRQWCKINGIETYIYERKISIVKV